MKNDTHYSNYIVNSVSEKVRDTFISKGMLFFRFIAISLAIAINVNADVRNQFFNMVGWDLN